MLRMKRDVMIGILFFQRNQKKNENFNFFKFSKIENKRRARREKREKTKIPPEWTPCVRDTNWFLVSNEM